MIDHDGLHSSNLHRNKDKKTVIELKKNSDFWTNTKEE